MKVDLILSLLTNVRSPLVTNLLGDIGMCCNAKVCGLKISQPNKNSPHSIISVQEGTLRKIASGFKICQTIIRRLTNGLRSIIGN